MNYRKEENRIPSVMRRDSDLDDNELPSRKNRVSSVIMRRDSDQSDNELPNRKNRIAIDLMKRESDLGDNEDDTLPDDRVNPNLPSPPRPKKYDYQAEILRLQKKMSKLQGKVTLLQKRVTHLQSQ